MAHKHIKVEISLSFERWKNDQSAPPVTLAASEDELSISTVLTGTMSIDKGMLYQILKAATERGITPVFELTIPE